MEKIKKPEGSPRVGKKRILQFFNQNLHIKGFGNKYARNYDFF